ncbi:MAG: DUF3307 domain-containing protein [Pseudooceanicola sp.]
MFETLTALLFAHVFADFVFQTRWMVAHKRNLFVMLFHAGIVLITAMTAVGHTEANILVALAGAHLFIDMVKTWGMRDSAGAFLGDQIAHLVTIVVAAWIVPDLWGTGVWAMQTAVPPVLILHMMVLTGGTILAIRAGGAVVSKLMAPFGEGFTSGGLPNGGHMIGVLERTLIFVLVLFGQPASIGFLIAAKSVMRFETASKEQRAAEYVIIGTLASFAWAFVVTMGVIALRSQLPALEIALPSP